MQVNIFIRLLAQCLKVLPHVFSAVLIWAVYVCVFSKYTIN